MSERRQRRKIAKCDHQWEERCWFLWRWLKASMTGSRGVKEEWIAAANSGAMAGAVDASVLASVAGFIMSWRCVVVTTDAGAGAHERMTKKKLFATSSTVYVHCLLNSAGAFFRPRFWGCLLW